MLEIYVKGSGTGERVEASLWVVSQSRARCVMLSPLNPRHHLVQAFPLQMKELRCREGGVPAHNLQSAAPTPSFSFLIIATVPPGKSSEWHFRKSLMAADCGMEWRTGSGGRMPTGELP